MDEQIFIQPCGNSLAKEHFVKTIENGLPFSEIEKYLTEKPELAETIKNVYGNKNVRFWGVKNRKDLSENVTWGLMKANDAIYFARDNEYFLYARVVDKLKNPLMAKEIWKIDEDQNTWENIYFITDLEERHISYKEFNILCDYKKNAIPQGFKRLAGKCANRLKDHFNLIFSPIVKTESSDKIRENARNKLKKIKNTDRKTQINARVEQQCLKDLLFANDKVFQCGICGKTYPVSLSVASHIYPRKSCNENERLDYDHIVMPMCTLGCDKAYEVGYIVVDDSGIIRFNENKDYITPALRAHFASIVDKKCEWWNDGSKEYFHKHYETHTKK